MKKQIVGLLLALFLLAGLLPTTVFAAEGDVTYLYYDANDANWQTGTKAGPPGYRRPRRSVQNAGELYGCTGDLTAHGAGRPAGI